MKKMIYLMLLFMFLGAAGAKAQVVIGGGDAATPDASAILELRSSNKGLLLPQVELSSTTDVSKIPTPANGLLVCNATGSLDKGVYYWSNNQWVLYIKF